MSSYDQTFAQAELERWIALGRTRPGVIDAAGPVEKMTWIAEHPYLAGVAGWGRLSLNDVTLASMSHSYDWGASFERLYRRPPAMDDWRAGYYNIANDFCERLGMQDAFSGDDRRLRLEYGGPF